MRLEKKSNSKGGGIFQCNELFNVLSLITFAMGRTRRDEHGVYGNKSITQTVGNLILMQSTLITRYNNLNQRAMRGSEFEREIGQSRQIIRERINASYRYNEFLGQ